MRDDDLSEVSWREVSDWLRMRGLALTLRVDCGAYVAQVSKSGDPVVPGARWWLSTGTSAAEAISRVLKRCREGGGEPTLLEQGASRG